MEQHGGSPIHSVERRKPDINKILTQFTYGKSVLWYYIGQESDNFFGAQQLVTGRGYKGIIFFLRSFLVLYF